MRGALLVALALAAACTKKARPTVAQVTLETFTLRTRGEGVTAAMAVIRAKQDQVLSCIEATTGATAAGRRVGLSFALRADGQGFAVKAGEPPPGEDLTACVRRKAAGWSVQNAGGAVVLDAVFLARLVPKAAGTGTGTGTGTGK